MHHLIDPRSGEPAQTDILSVSVVAGRTVLAEVYAKVALILGAEQGLDYLQSLPDVAGMIYRQDGRMLFTDTFCSLLS
jgi:thiamine biosynthesis lipoprotein